MVELLAFPEHFEGLERFHIFFFIRHPLFCNLFCQDLEDLDERRKADDEEGAYDPEDHILGEGHKKDGIHGDNTKYDQCFKTAVNMGHQQFFSFLLSLEHIPGKPVEIGDPVRCITDVLDDSKGPLRSDGKCIYKITSDQSGIPGPVDRIHAFPVLFFKKETGTIVKTSAVTLHLHLTLPCSASGTKPSGPFPCRYPVQSAG
jgi:hypothetical protein